MGRLAAYRLSPDKREGVLGQTKAKYFDRGWLRSWMIRSPLASVQRRLVRRGLLDPTLLEVDPDPWTDGDDDDDAPIARGYDKFEEIRLIRQFVNKAGVFKWDAKEDLGEFYSSHVQALLRRLLDLNYLRSATIAERLALRFNVGQLRAACNSRALAVDGSKMEMADRLCVADPQWAASEGRLVAVALTDTGRSFLKRLTVGGYYAEDIEW